MKNLNIPTRIAGCEPVVIEIPKGSRHKYEYRYTDADSASNGGSEFVLDRVVDLPYPCHYGFIPYTLADDGDALDVIMLGDDPAIGTGSILQTEVIGMLDMYDTVDGEVKRDAKMLVVPQGSDIRPTPEMKKAIEDFFSSYKAGVTVVGFFGKKSALPIIGSAYAAYKYNQASLTAARDMFKDLPNLDYLLGQETV